MKKLIACAALGTLLLVGCNENNSINTPADKPAGSPQRIISEIAVGGGSLTFIVNGDYIATVEKQPSKDEKILGPEMVGLTWAEIHQRLAPGKKVPAELLQSKERFGMEPESAGPDAVNPDGHNSGSDLPGPLAKAWDPSYFQANYCNPGSGDNAYNTCMLSQQNWTYAFVYATVSRSRVNVNPYMGSQMVHIRGTVDGVGVFDWDMQPGFNSYYNFYMYSKSALWGLGCRMNLRHRYDITSAPGAGWHWSFFSGTLC